ncbi:hypothetical protein ACWD4P_24100 [Kitasatospora sp. NPDC002543]
MHAHGESKDRAESREAESGHSSAGRLAARGTTPLPPLSALQRSVGNAAVGRMLHEARDHTAGGAAVQRMSKVPKKAPKKASRRRKASTNASNASSAPKKPRTPSAAALRNQAFAEAVKTKLKAAGWVAEGSHEVWSRMTFHRVSGVDATEKDYQSGTAAYKANPANAIARAPFDDKRDKQAMRWISTAVMEYLKLLGKPPIEIQAAVHDGTLYLSANNNAALATLESQAAGKTGEVFLTEVIGKVREIPGFGGRGDDDRLARHTRKAHTRLTGAAGTEAGPETEAEAETATTRDYAGDYRNVINALKNPVTVVTAGEDGFHAERRIVGHLTAAAEKRAEEEAQAAGLPHEPGSVPQVVPESLAGTKRPCVSCYIKLFQGQEGVRPGPHWMSRAANMEMPGYALQDAAGFADYLVERISNTYATLVWQCDEKVHDTKVTTDYGTDSDSDHEGYDSDISMD